MPADATRPDLRTLIADEIQERGRKHASGEPLYFDRHNLELAIEAALSASVAAPQEEPRFGLPHWCQDEHQPIAHNDSEHERCPLCRANDEIAALKAASPASVPTPAPPVEVTAPKELGFDLASKIAGYCRVYGHYVPDSLLRTVLILIEADDRDKQPASVPTQEKTYVENERIGRREHAVDGRTVGASTPGAGVSNLAADEGCVAGIQGESARDSSRVAASVPTRARQEDESLLMAALVKISLMPVDRLHVGEGNTYYNLSEHMKRTAVEAIQAYQRAAVLQPASALAEQEKP